MKIKFRDIHLSKKNKVRLDLINEIIDDYKSQGYKLTLRQLYYRLVTRNVVANEVKEYDKLGHLLTEGRMAGIVDWDAIEDRVRQPKNVYHNDDVEDAVNDAYLHYRLDRQLGQKNYVELWVEKDAISNILFEKSAEFGINLMVNRGYSSTSAMYESYNRFVKAIKNKQKPCILYLGDHDPSGLDMVLNDIPKRINESFGVKCDVKHIGITMPQIKQFAPPPNPAKISDPRANWYIENFGNESWEVDALEPAELHRIIDTHLEGLLDMKKIEELKEQEIVDRAILKQLPAERNRISAVREILGDIDFKKEKNKNLKLIRNIVND